MFLQILKLKSPSFVVVAPLVCLLACLLALPAFAQVEQTAEQAVQDVDAAYEAAPRKLFQAKPAPNNSASNKSTKPKSTKKKSRDFVEAYKPARKIVRKSAPVKTEATIEANDLMDGMRESMNPTANVVVQDKVENAAAASVPAGQQIIKPLPSDTLFQPVAKAAEDALPPVTQKNPAATETAKAAPT